MFTCQRLLVAPDAHSKNYSLLHHRDQNAVRLAPLHDVTSWLPYWDRRQERKMKLAMKYGSDYTVRHRRSVWEGFADDLELGPDYIVGRLQNLADRIPDAFSDPVELGTIGRPSSPTHAAASNLTGSRR